MTHQGANSLRVFNTKFNGGGGQLAMHGFHEDVIINCGPAIGSSDVQILYFQVKHLQ